MELYEPYRSLMQDFISGKLPAQEFSLAYMDRMKLEDRPWSDDLFDVLESMFAEANSYTPNEDWIKDDPDFFISESQLKDHAVKALEKLDHMIAKGLAV